MNDNNKNYILINFQSQILTHALDNVQWHKTTQKAFFNEW